MDGDEARRRAREHNATVVADVRAGRDPAGMSRDRILLLTTTGRRSRQPRTTPMMFHREADRVLVIASNAGAPADPDWYRNLIADPAVHVEVGGESYAARAAPLDGADYDRSWMQIKTAYPFFADHEKVAGRPIPVVALTAG